MPSLLIVVDRTGVLISIHFSDRVSGTNTRLHLSHYSSPLHWRFKTFVKSVIFSRQLSGEYQRIYNDLTVSLSSSARRRFELKSSTLAVSKQTRGNKPKESQSDREMDRTILQPSPVQSIPVELSANTIPDVVTYGIKQIHKQPRAI